MNKIISKFKKTIRGLSDKYKSYDKPIRILIPTSILLVIGLVVGVLYLIDYNKSPVLAFANVSSSKSNQTDKSSYVLKGQIDSLSGTALFINGVKVKIDNDGSFSYTLKLTEGKNKVEIKIVRNGKEIKNSYTINRTVEKAEDPNITEAKAESDVTSQDTTKKTASNSNTTAKPSTPSTPTPPVTPPTPPATPPTPPVLAAIRIEVSSDGCYVSYYAPENYSIIYESGDSIDHIPRRGSTAPMQSISPYVMPTLELQGSYFNTKIYTSEATRLAGETPLASSGNIDVLNNCR